MYKIIKESAANDLSGTLKVNFSQLKEAIIDVVNNPNKYKDKKHLGPLILTVIPLFMIVFNRVSGGSKASAFMLGFSSVSVMFSDLYRAYVMGTIYGKNPDIQISYRYDATDYISFFLTGTSSAFFVMGIILSLIISRIFISKFSKRRLLKSKNIFSFGAYYSAGSFVGLLIGLILFLIHTKNTMKDFSLRDAFIGYIKMIKDSIKNVFTFGTNERMGLAFSLSLIFNLIILFIQFPLIVRLFKTVFGRKQAPIVYEGKIDKKKIKDATIKISKLVGKDLEKEAEKLASKVKLSPDGLCNILSAYLSSKKFVNKLSDFKLIKDVLTGKNKPEEILTFKSADVKNIKDNLLKEDSTSVAIKFGGNPDSITQIAGLDSLDVYNQLLKSPPIKIVDKKTFKIACYKAVVDLYEKLKLEGYRINDVKLIITRKFAPPFSLDNNIVLGYMRALWNGFTSDHVAAVLAHEMGHVFNQDTKISLMSIAPTLLSGLASFSYYNFNLSTVPKAERILLGFTFNISFLQVLEAGRTAEINADAFAIKLGYVKELYDFLKHATDNFGPSDAFSKLFEELDEHDRSDRRLKALMDFIKDNLNINKDILELAGIS